MRAIAVLGNGIPVDGVAKGFVQAHAVLIDRDALRHALKRRGFEAVQAQVLEHGVALGVGQGHAGGLVAQRVQHRCAMLGGELVGAECFAIRQALFRRLADVGIGQGAIDDDMLGRFAGCHLLGQGGHGEQAGGGQQAQADFHAFPFFLKGLEQARARAQFPEFPEAAGIFPEWQMPMGARLRCIRFCLRALMSLRGQFFLSVVMALLLSLSVLGVVALGHARASVDNEMRMALEAGDRIVDNALLSLPHDGEDAYLERLVKSFDGNRHLRVVLIEAGREVTASSAGRARSRAWLVPAAAGNSRAATHRYRAATGRAHS